MYFLAYLLSVPRYWHCVGQAIMYFAKIRIELPYVIDISPLLSENEILHYEWSISVTSITKKIPF